MADLNQCYGRLLDVGSKQYHKLTTVVTESMKQSFKNTFNMDYDQVLDRPSSETPTTIEFITTFKPSIYMNLLLYDKHYIYYKQTGTWIVSKCENKL